VIASTALNTIKMDGNFFWGTRVTVQDTSDIQPPVIILKGMQRFYTR
jgi:hypothetical protein